MKKISLILLLICTVASTALAGGWKLTEKTRLYYEVNAMGNRYYFIVSNIKKTSAGLQFSYEMTNSSNLSAEVSISKEALATATSQVNFFNGEPLTLTDATTVWISEKVYAALSTKKSIGIDAGNGEESLSFDHAEKLSIPVDGVPTKFKALAGETGSDSKFLILKDPNNPLILNMDLGWTIQLIEICENGEPQNWNAELDQR